MTTSIKPAVGEMVHVYNRGVEKREIFLDDEDRFRFIHDLYEFNDMNPALNVYYRKSNEVGLRKRDFLVSIISFVMMPNHFHLLLVPEKENGVTEFMRKLGTGYTNYFNKKYDRVGSLFQGKFKTQAIETVAHHEYLPCYVHLNPVKLIFPEWTKGINEKNRKKALLFIRGYRWSSLLDCTGRKNFPSVINKRLFHDYFGNETVYKKSLEDYLMKSDFVRPS